MSKEDVIKLNGEITEVLPNTTFKVKLENNVTIIAYVSGKMRKYQIRLTLGDSVEVELSPYDITKGRIVRRK